MSFDRQNLILVLLALLQPLISCPGCSVKEDRDLCPSYLDIDIQIPDTLASDVLLALSPVCGGTSFFLSDTISVDKAASRVTWEGVVPRQKLRVVCMSLSGTDQAIGSSPKSAVLINKGEDCPKVWMSTGIVDASAETAYYRCRLSKSFAVMTVDVVGTKFPFKAEVRGNVNGYGIDGEPMSGLFSVLLDFSGDGCDTVSLPRQIDDSLILEVIADDGRSIRRFAVGNYIRESGYDWTDDDLQDIDLSIDLALTEIVIVVGGWRRRVSFEEVK